MFRIKLIILRSELNVAYFWICMTVRSSVLVVFNNFLLINATDRSKISSDRKRLFFTVNQYLSFFANIPLRRTAVSLIVPLYIYIFSSSSCFVPASHLLTRTLENWRIKTGKKRVQYFSYIHGNTWTIEMKRRIRTIHYP